MSKTLSRRQQKVANTLRYLVMAVPNGRPFGGFTAYEIAKAAGLHPRSVHNDLQEIMQKQDFNKSRVFWFKINLGPRRYWRIARDPVIVPDKKCVVCGVPMIGACQSEGRQWCGNVNCKAYGMVQ